MCRLRKSKLKLQPLNKALLVALAIVFVLTGVFLRSAALWTGEFDSAADFPDERQRLLNELERVKVARGQYPASLEEAGIDHDSNVFYGCLYWVEPDGHFGLELTRRIVFPPGHHTCNYRSDTRRWHFGGEHH